MNILMIDTSGPACGVAIMADGRLVYEAELTHRQTHSQRVMPMVDTALQMSDMTAADMDVFGAVVGPGSFTGVRIGVSTVKALAHAAGKPCVKAMDIYGKELPVPAYEQPAELTNMVWNYIHHKKTGAPLHLPAQLPVNLEIIGLLEAAVRSAQEHREIEAAQ